MASKSFKARLEPEGGGAYFNLPFSVEEAFGTRAVCPVRGTINGFAFRSSVFPKGDGTHYMAVNKAVRAGAGATIGDTVRVRMERDTEPREVALPADFKKALGKNKEAKLAFDKLSYTHRKEFVGWIEEARREETRARRIEKSLSMLIEGKTR